MSDEVKDPPLEPIADGGTYVGVVVDFDSVRIKSGRTPFRIKTCQHKHMIYCQSERRIWCEDCERTIENFDAFLTLTRHFENMEREARHKLSTATEALARAARLRATKELDRIWSGRRMAPCCPHCSRGLIPEDFAGGAAAAISLEWEMARRKKPSSPS